MADTFTCAHCGGTFDNPLPEDEAVAESEALFPGITPESRVEICHSCWLRFMEWAKEMGLVGVPVEQGLARLREAGLLE